MTRLPRFACCVLVAASAATLVQAANPDGLELPFDRLHGVYEDLPADVAPIESGPVSIRLSSPSHRLELLASKLELGRLGGDRHRVRGMARFSGTGTLVTELDFGGVPASFRDNVVLPEQDVFVEGTISVEVVDEGYLVTVEELPGFLALQMDSALGSQLVAWCNRLALFVAGDAGCRELDRELSHPKLPLPAAGSEHLIRWTDLTEAERAQIDVYLSSF